MPYVLEQQRARKCFGSRISEWPREPCLLFSPEQNTQPELCRKYSVRVSNLEVFLCLEFFPSRTLEILTFQAEWSAALQPQINYTFFYSKTNCVSWCALLILPQILIVQEHRLAQLFCCFAVLQFPFHLTYLGTLLEQRHHHWCVPAADRTIQWTHAAVVHMLDHRTMIHQILHLEPHQHQSCGLLSACDICLKPLAFAYTSHFGDLKA